VYLLLMVAAPVLRGVKTGKPGLLDITAGRLV
jgi:hypothetical protein